MDYRKRAERMRASIEEAARLSNSVEFSNQQRLINEYVKKLEQGEDTPEYLLRELLFISGFERVVLTYDRIKRERKAATEKVHNGH